MVITLRPVNAGECTSNSECGTGGCSGEVCAPKGEASKMVTPCVYRPWYSCFALTSCGCVNGVCTWKPNPTFERCLREHGVDPSKVIRSGYFELKIRGINKPDEDINASVKDFLGAFGVSCSAPLILVKTSVTRLSPQVDPSEANASRAVKAELEWLRNVAALEIDDADVGAIAKVAEWGFAGHNGKIGWYEAKNGSYAWMPYYKSRNPLLIRCSSREVPSYELSNGTAYVGPTPTQRGQEPSTPTSPPRICGPGVMILLPLALLGRR